MVGAAEVHPLPPRRPLLGEVGVDQRPARVAVEVVRTGGSRPVRVEPGDRRLDQVVGPVPVAAEQVRDLAEPARPCGHVLGEVVHRHPPCPVRHPFDAPGGPRGCPARASRRFIGVHDIDTVTAATIEKAAERLAGVVTRTPLEPSARLSSRVDAQVWVKREDLQTVRSYKIRGAYNFIVQLDEATRALGVVCASAGNHAQGVAYACRASARTAACTSRAPRRGRSASASRRSAARTSRSSSSARRTKTPSPRPTRTPSAPARRSCRRSTTSGRSPARARSPWR